MTSYLTEKEGERQEGRGGVGDEIVGKLKQGMLV